MYVLEGFEVIFEKPPRAGSLHPCLVIFQVPSDRGKRNHVLSRQLVLHWIPTGALKAIQASGMPRLRAYPARHQWHYCCYFNKTVPGQWCLNVILVLSILSEQLTFRFPDARRNKPFFL